MSRVVHERGVAVLVVLVVLAIGALAGTVALLAARSAGEAASVSAGRLQSRLTMRSGVLVLEQMAIQQRIDVLGGAEFVVDGPIELFTEGNRTAMFRLDARMTEAPVSLDALLDVNTADAEMLAKLPGMDEALAVEMAAALPVRSLRELLEVEGVTVELLYGEYDESGRLISEGVPLASLLTVGSVDPQVAVGVPGSVVIPAGTPRYRVDASFGVNAEEDRVRPLMEDQTFQQLTRRIEISRPRSRRAIVSLLREQGQDASSWGYWLDACAVTADPVAGRIDINRAPVEVLAVIPGFDEGIAQQIVDARGSMGSEALCSVLWPYEQGLVDEEGMLSAVDRITTRSVRWVLRAEAGVATVRERAVGVDSLEDARRIRAGMAGEDRDRLGDRVAMDYLVDFSGERPVVLPLGEVSIAGELAAVSRVLADAREAGGELDPSAVPSSRTGGRR